MSTKRNKDTRATTEFKKNRAILLADNPPCHWCGINQATQADHYPVEADAGGSNQLSNLVPACQRCNASRGNAYRVRKEREKNGLYVIEPKQKTTQSSDAIFYSDDSKPPQQRLRISEKDQPELAPTGRDLPRLSTMRDDQAQDFAAEIGEFSEKILGVKLMPWQLHVLGNMTCHKDGEWINRQSLVSVARQNGKSVAIQALIGWWLATQGAARGEPQTVISVAHKLDLATQTFKSLALKLEAKLGAKVVWSYGRMSLEMPDGSQWQVRAATPQCGHGYSPDLVVVDEVWAVSEAALDEGLLPGQRARPNPLCAMFSTAGTQESKAMLRWREQGVRQIDAGEIGPLYFAEYSPPSGLDPMSHEAWEYANPALGHTLKMKVIESEAKAPNRNAFLRGSVNIWTASSTGWLEAGLWESCRTEETPPPNGVLAIEASTEESRYVGVRAVRAGNKTLVTVAFDVDSMAGMWAAVDRLMTEMPQLRLAIGQSLEIHCPPKFDRRKTTVGYRELLKWTLAVRSMIVESRLQHTGELLLAEHVERAVMIKHQGSVALSSTRSPGPIELARCMVWAAALESRPSSAGKPIMALSG